MGGASRIHGRDAYFFFFCWNLKGRDHSEGLAIDGKRNRVGRRGLDLSGSEWGPVVGSCEHGNERSGSIKDGYFLV
jgi:hypothetical protein